MHDRSSTWRRLEQPERTSFRVAGRSDAQSCIEDVNGPTFVINPWHHPEYRIGALTALLSAAKEDSERLNDV